MTSLLKSHKVSTKEITFKKKLDLHEGNHLQEQLGLH